MMKTEKGSALIVSLILLLGLMAIGISAMQTIQVNYRTTSNFNNIQVSFQSAEAGLAQAEGLIRSTPTTFDYCSDKKTMQCIWPDGQFSTSSFLDGTAWKSAQNGDHTISSAVAAPAYIIQEVGYQAFELNPDAKSQGKGTYYYRITSKGYGSKPYSAAPTSNESSQSIVESVFVKSY